MDHAALEALEGECPQLGLEAGRFEPLRRADQFERASSDKHAMAARAHDPRVVAERAPLERRDTVRVVDRDAKRAAMVGERCRGDNGCV